MGHLRDRHGAIGIHDDSFGSDSIYYLFSLYTRLNVSWFLEIGKMIERNKDWDPFSDDAEFDKICKGSEDSEQMALMGWAARAIFHGKFPELVMLHHVPNGGERNVVIATKLKAMGAKAGVPDLFLDVPRHGLHGLRIEMKRADGGTASKEQLVWRDRYYAQGFGWALAHGWKEARAILIQWLE